MPNERVEMDTLYPYKEGETPEAWTRRVLSHAGEHGTYRQCTIGWHDECSQRAEDNPECMCICHDPNVSTYTVEGHCEGGTLTLLRAEKGKLDWPAVEGEPATMWAWWVFGTSVEDAAKRAMLKEARRIANADS